MVSQVSDVAHGPLVSKVRELESKMVVKWIETVLFLPLNVHLLSSFLFDYLCLTGHCQASPECHQSSGGER